MDTNTDTGIALTAKHNPLAWLLYFTKLTVNVDGEPQIHKWGSTFVPAQPGSHRLEVSFGYLGRPRGNASTTVIVPDGGVVALTYRMPSWMFSPGKLTDG